MCWKERLDRWTTTRSAFALTNTAAFARKEGRRRRPPRHTLRIGRQLLNRVALVECTLELLLGRDRGWPRRPASLRRIEREELHISFDLARTLACTPHTQREREQRDSRTAGQEEE